MGFEPAKPSPSNIKEVNTDAFTTQMEEIWKILQDKMLIGQANHKCYAHWHCNPASQYKIRDLVRLNTRSFFTKRSSKKLENCHASKYQGKKIISNHVVELNLPHNLHVHPVFHVNCFQPAASNDPYLGYVQSSDPSIKVDKETKYEVIAIVDFWLFERTKKLEYCIQ